MKRGYIHLWRKFLSHQLWQERRKFSRAEAWIDMILQTNGTDKNVIFDGRSIIVKRGQLLTSERKLAEHWGWSKTKTRVFLNGLQKVDRMIERESDHKKTLITILNYELYNPLSEQKKTSDIEEEKTTERPLKDHRLAPTKKDKEGKESNNLYITQIIDHWNSKGIKILEDRESKVKIKTVTKIKSWLKDYDFEEIIEAIDNYFQILKSEEYYFSHKWQLWEFLERGLINFLTKNKPFDNYKIGQEYKVSQIGKHQATQYSEKEKHLISKIDAEYNEKLKKVMEEEGWESEEDIDYFKGVPTQEEYRERRLGEIKKCGDENVC